MVTNQYKASKKHVNVLANLIEMENVQTGIRTKLWDIMAIIGFSTIFNKS